MTDQGMKVTVEFQDFTGKYLPLHEEMASGEHPEHGPFRVLRSMMDGALIVEGGDRRKVLTLRAIMDGFFEAWNET